MLRAQAADVRDCLDGIEVTANQQTFFLYAYEPGGNRIELCNAGARSGTRMIIDCGRTDRILAPTNH